MRATEKALREMVTDATLEKKKHYNAAARKRCYQKAIAVTIIGITLLSGSSFLYLLTNAFSKVLSLVSAILAFFGAFLAFLQLQNNYSSAVEAHIRQGNRFLSLAKDCRLTLALFKDDTYTEDKLVEKTLEYRQHYGRIVEDSESCPTNNRDYKKARKGIEQGEEHYSANDMSIGEEREDG